jgi:hypothetical protein
MLLLASVSICAQLSDRIVLHYIKKQKVPVSQSSPRLKALRYPCFADVESFARKPFSLLISPGMIKFHKLWAMLMSEKPKILLFDEILVGFISRIAWYKLLKAQRDIGMDSSNVT